MIRLLQKCGSGVALLGLLSLVVATLQFVVPLYMMAIYNRILQTGSIETLKLISLIAGVLLLILGIAEVARSRTLALMARRISDYLDNDVYQAVLSGPSSALGQALRDKQSSGVPNAHPDHTIDPRTQAMTDLRQVSGFVASGALNTLFDAVLAPLFLLALFILNPLLGWIGVGATAVILALAFLGEVLARRANAQIGKAEGRAQRKIERSLGQSDAVAAMGIAPSLYTRWKKDRDEATVLGLRNQTLVGMIGGLAKSVRLIVQMAMLGVGAWLALTTDTFLAGAIIASSIIMGRALAPIDQSITLWQRFMKARAGAARLMLVLDAVDAQNHRGSAPTPVPVVTLDKVTLGYPKQRNPMLQSASFTIKGGEVFGILGANGAGKTTLLRAVAGLHLPRSGTISLGATPTDGFNDDDRHNHFGYLPQDIQLLPGTMAENISRFRGDPLKPEPLFAAAHLVGATAMIQSLPDGFATPFEDGTLSAGQTQSIGLARAFYEDPTLVLLDEPTANLDVQAKHALAEAIAARKAAGLITVFTSHDQDLLRQADQLLFMSPEATKLGAADEILRYIAHLAQNAASKGTT